MTANEHCSPTLPKTVKRFWPLLAAQRWRVGAAYGLSTVNVGFGLLIPWPLKFLIDDVLTGNTASGPLQQFSPSTQVLLLCGAMAVLALLAALTLSMERILHARVHEQFAFTLRDTIIAHVYRLSRFSRHAERSGELTMRLSGDVHQVGRMFCKTLPNAVKHLLVAALTLIVIFGINPLLGGIAMLVAAVFAAVVVRNGPRLTAAAKRKRKLEGAVSALTQETLQGLEHIQAMGLEVNARRRYLAEAQAALQAGVREIQVAVGLERSSQVIAGVGVAVIAAVGGHRVLSDAMTLGTLTVCLSYVAQLMKPLERINEIASSMSQGLVRAERIDSVLSAQTAVDTLNGTRLVPTIDTLSCRALSYQYPGLDAGILDDINIEFRRGECFAIIGPSGCGKTTLLRLLLRLQTPTRGDILCDGIPYDDIDLLSLQSNFAVVFQNAHLFAGTYREVLSELREQTTETEMWQALDDVALTDVISALPGGLDAVIDERADRLSGGQKARLMLARALLGQRSVVILDEPFANIDHESKRIILERLKREKQSHMLIVVSHERVLLELADHIINLGAAEARNDVPQMRRELL
ncbi:MAG: ABC transporter ATP-binding protein [Gammaproteobacteria bacterium]|nr:ABC transporter ATP-binding protein [Gammaproteobacteria bacterium]